MHKKRIILLCHYRVTSKLILFVSKTASLLSACSILTFSFPSFEAITLYFSETSSYLPSISRISSFELNIITSRIDNLSTKGSPNCL